MLTFNFLLLYELNTRTKSHKVATHAHAQTLFFNRARDGKCPKPRPVSDVGAVVGRVYYVYGSTEGKLQSLLAEYSVVAASFWLNAQSAANFRAYRGGVFDGCVPGGPQLSGHAMAVVGYGQENGVDYWLMKNSWGKAWGERGYMKMRRGVKACGLGDKGLAVVTCRRPGDECEEGDEYCNKVGGVNKDQEEEEEHNAK
jgi:Papain family cysteine protease